MRRLALSLVAGCVLAAAPAAHASRLVTWTTTSRYVDPAKVRFNGPPPGVAAGPPALRVNVLLPDGYDGRRRFPVLYLLHGHGDTYAHWASPARGNVAAIARGLGAIIVMPEGGRGWYANWWNEGRRGDPAWERYHLDELIPLVERRLRVRAGRRWHAIAGLSMGGEGAIFYAGQRPGYFGSAASFSGVLSLQRPEWPSGFDTQGERHQDVFGDPDAQRFYWTGHNPTALAGNLRHTRVFVAVGNGVPGTAEDATNTLGQAAELELSRQADDFVAAARAAGVDTTYRPQQGIHDWPYWRRHLAQALQWGLFGAVPDAPGRWTYATVAQSGEMWGLRFRFAAPPTTLIEFSRSGERLKASGAGAVTVTTPEGCRLTAALPFDLRLPSGCRIRLAVRPRSVHAGRVVRLRFRATVVRAGRRLAVRGARVSVASRRCRTGRSGRCSLRLRARRRGSIRARASRRGLLAGTALVRAR